RQARLPGVEMPECDVLVARQQIADRSLAPPGRGGVELTGPQGIARLALLLAMVFRRGVATPRGGGRERRPEGGDEKKRAARKTRHGRLAIRTGRFYPGRAGEGRGREAPRRGLSGAVAGGARAAARRGAQVVAIHPGDRLDADALGARGLAL